MKVRRRHARKARPILIWTAIVYALCQAAFVWFMDARRAGWVDHQYGWNLREARERQKEGTDLAVLMGGSRSVNGFIPEWVEPIILPDGRKVAACNFAHTSGGPLMNLVELRRMLRDGVKPKWLVFEIMPGMLTHESATNTRDFATIGDIRAGAKEMGLWATMGRWARLRYNVFYRMRQDFEWEFLPAWVPEELSEARARYRDQRGPHWVDGFTEAQLPAVIKETRDDYYADVHEFKLSPTSDKSLRGILDICRAEGIRAALLWAPEGKEFKSWYTAESRAEFLAYMKKVAAEYDVPFVDAQDWIGDEGLFLDSHHLKLAGSKVYTPMFYERVMRPLVLGKLGK